MSKIQSESNSQPAKVSYYLVCSCDQYVKDTIWKQFTTADWWLSYGQLLWPICQRYNLKAIHNVTKTTKKRFCVVTNMSKIQSESNSQPFPFFNSNSPRCDQYVKDTIWKQFTTYHEPLHLTLQLWPICQRYNLKAIHNTYTGTRDTPRVVTNMSKIQSESNSQLLMINLKFLSRCDQYVKDTIWKQFTTSHYVTFISV